MEKILWILTFAVSLTCQGQEFPPNKMEPYDFSKIEAKISNSKKLSLLQKLIFTKYLIPANLETIESYDFSNYHVLDFNADGRLDVIYDGRNPGGIETNNVVFFLNNGDSLKPVIKLNGDFIKINIKNGQLQGFQLIKSPCCANFIYRIENYELRSSKDCFVPKNGDHDNYKYSYGQVNAPEFCVSLVDKYGYVMKTEFPINTKVEDTLEISKKAFLTPKPSKPSSTDFEEDGLSFHFNENKAISELTKGMRCYVLSKKQNSEGDVFCFVLLVNTNGKNNYMKHIDFNQYGWVNKNKLK